MIWYSQNREYPAQGEIALVGETIREQSTASKPIGFPKETNVDAVGRTRNTEEKTAVRKIRVYNKSA